MVSETFREIFTGPTSLYHWLNKKRSEAPDQSTTTIYIFHASGTELSQKVVGSRCAWCVTLVFRDIDCLMIHLENFHQHFKYIIKQRKQTTSCEIAVHINDEHSNHEFFEFKADGTRFPKSFAIPEKSILPSPLSSKKFTSGTFVNSRSFIPFTANSDIIAENNTCEHWIQQQNDEEIDGTKGIVDGAKLLMKLWNRSMEQKRSLSDSSFPDLCIKFASKHAEQIVKLELRQIFVRQLLNFCDDEIIEKDCLVNCLKIIDDYVVEN
ncbi:21659_t:CDS:2 [Entrophospora sp. SA101]|nr:21659_t:CDS:2 [Entrophospora sp. SA101]